MPSVRAAWVMRSSPALTSGAAVRSVALQCNRVGGTAVHQQVSLSVEAPHRGGDVFGDAIEGAARIFHDLVHAFLGSDVRRPCQCERPTGFEGFRHQQRSLPIGCRRGKCPCKPIRFFRVMAVSQGRQFTARP